MACTIMIPPINILHKLTLVIFKAPQKKTRNNLAPQKYKERTRLENYNMKLVGVELLISRTYTSVKSQ